MPSFLHPNGTFYADASIAPMAAAPATGATVSMSGPSLYMTPAGTLATLTIKLPANPKPGQLATILSSAIVTALTMQTATGGAVAGSPTALAVNTKVTMQYIGAATGWVWVR